MDKRSSIFFFQLENKMTPTVKMETGDSKGSS